jgi:predicted aspartyl protease
MNKGFFKFRNGYASAKDNLNDFERLYLGAFSDAISGNAGNSNDRIKNLFSSYSDALTDSMKFELLKSKADNLILMNNYKEAFVTLKELLSNYESIMSKEEFGDYRDTENMMEILQDSPPMNIVKKEESNISISKDLAGLINLPVNISGNQLDFVFDTGANFSVITKSNAIKVNMKLSEKTFKVGTATGIKVDSWVGISGQINIGNCVLDKVAFIVLPDEALSFAGGFYKIQGIIGIPVAIALSEITLKDFKEMIIPAKPDTLPGNYNICFFGLLPVVNLERGIDSLAFIFDSGAQATMLYVPYYNKYKNEIDDNYKPEKFHIGGAGGDTAVIGYKIDTVKLKSESYSVSLSDVRLISEKIKDTHLYFFGNLGQDFFKKSKNIKINFRNPSMVVD